MNSPKSAKERKKELSQAAIFFYFIAALMWFFNLNTLAAIAVGVGAVMLVGAIVAASRATKDPAAQAAPETTATAKPRAKTTGGSLVFLFILFIAVYYFIKYEVNSSADSSHSAAHKTASSPHGLVVLKYRIKNTHIVGAAQNDTGHACDMATVDFKIFNQRGEQIDSANDVIDDLSQGQIWHFRALVNVDAFYSVSPGQMTCE